MRWPPFDWSDLTGVLDLEPFDMPEVDAEEGLLHVNVPRVPAFVFY